MKLEFKKFTHNQRLSDDSATKLIVFLLTYMSMGKKLLRLVMKGAAEVTALILMVKPASNY